MPLWQTEFIKPWALLCEVRALEDGLNQAKRAHATQLRRDQPDLIFRDLHAEPDKLWVDNLHKITEQTLATQSKLVGTLPALFEALHEQWKKRWRRRDNIPHSQWTQIVDLAQHAFPEQRLPHNPLLLQAGIHQKKARSASSEKLKQHFQREFCLFGMCPSLFQGKSCFSGVFKRSLGF